MKKFFALITIVAMLASMTAAYAEDLGVQVIGGPGKTNIPMSLDDLQLGTSYTLDGYAIITPKEMKTIDCFAQFGETGDYSVDQINPHDGHLCNSIAPVFAHSESEMKWCSWKYKDAAWMDSELDADFVWLLMDVVNLQKKEVEYIGEASVKVVYQDEYEFNGWMRQIVYNHMEAQNGDRGLSRYSYEKEDYPNEIVLNPSKVEAIDMMYTGTYAFGCTLPNYVIEDTKSPLRIEITMGENELTYHVRK